jgi:ribonucleoside-diphosphate reductase alpha chain
VQPSQEISAKSGAEHGVNPALSGLSGVMPASSGAADYRILRRNGSVVGFEPSKISIAMTKAFLAVNGGQGAASARVRELVEQ